MGEFLRVVGNTVRRHPRAFIAAGIAVAVLPVELGIERVGAAYIESGYDQDDALETVRERGYEEPRLEERNVWFGRLQGCGNMINSEFLSFGIEAVDDFGEEVDLLVCKGLWGGPSVYVDPAPILGS